MLFIVTSYVIWLVMGFVIWLVMGFVVACVADDKGFWVVGWSVYGVLLWPIALVHVLIAKPKEKVDEIAEDDPSHVGKASNLACRPANDRRSRHLARRQAAR